MLHDWKQDYTRQSQPPARGAPLGKQRLVVCCFNNYIISLVIVKIVLIQIKKIRY